MATNTGRRMGNEKGVQRNKESTGDKPNRSPGESNANRVLPSLNEDVGRSVSKDVDRVKKGLMPSTEAGRDLAPSGRDKLLRASQQEAGGRAMTRMGARAGYAASAFEAGYAGGRALDEETGVGKAAVNKSNVGRAAAEALSKSDRVKLSEGSKERLADMENDKSLRQIDKEKQASKYGKGDNEYAKGGYVNCGASVPPAQKGKK